MLGADYALWSMSCLLACVNVLAQWLSSMAHMDFSELVENRRYHEHLPNILSHPNRRIVYVVIPQLPLNRKGAGLTLLELENGFSPCTVMLASVSIVKFSSLR
jgi:hypothetical protein